MGVRLFLVLALVSLLVACAGAPDVSPQQLSQDLAVAHASQCSRLQPLVQNVDCYDSIDRPIWQREAPDTLDLYSRFNAQRRAAAAQYDSRMLSGKDFNAAIKAAQTELWTQVNQRRQYKDQKSAAETDDNAALFMMLGTSFLNGYNNARPAPVVTTSCTTNAGITNCLSY
ncbi:MAG TPA: hypothetical protein VFC38_11985 [Stellaceae bacterium]|nr:hypothetical protein [Stellaceae bacterium]